MGATHVYGGEASFGEQFVIFDKWHAYPRILLVLQLAPVPFGTVIKLT